MTFFKKVFAIDIGFKSSLAVEIVQSISSRRGYIQLRQ